VRESVSRVKNWAADMTLLGGGTGIGVTGGGMKVEGI